jgi:Tol biopolymer transport system component
MRSLNRAYSKNLGRPLVLVTSALLLTVSISPRLAVAADPKVDEQTIAPIAKDAKYIVSPHGGHLAAIVDKGSRTVVMIDGTAGPKVDEVITPVFNAVDPRPMQAMSTSERNAHPLQPVTFSEDGNHWAYLAQSGQDWSLIEDGKEVLKLPASGAVGGVAGIGSDAGNTDIRVQFAGADGKHLYFARSSFAGYELWVDGKKQPGYYASGTGGDGSVDPLISPDGEHFAYVAKMGTRPDDKQELIVDGKEAGEPVVNLHFTSDGKHLVGLQRKPDGDHLIIDGKSAIAAKAIYGLYLAPQGRSIIAVLRHDNPDRSIGQFLWVDGKPVEASLAQQISSVYFSPDGKHYAAVCQRPGAQWVVLDGKKGQEYQSITQAVENLSTGPAFSADGSKFGYVAVANTGKQFVVINDDESDAFDGANFAFSPDGKHTIMSGRQGGANVLILDGKTIKLPGNRYVGSGQVIYSPDGSRYAFTTATQNGDVYVDGQPSGLSGNVSFSPDSKHVVVAGQRSSDNKRGLFIDGKMIATTGQQTVDYRAFSPDSRHVYWMTKEPATGPGAVPNTMQWVTYADGKAVARASLEGDAAAAQKVMFPTGFGEFPTAAPCWSIGDNGAAIILAPAADGLKRITVTPANDDEVAALLAGAGKTN